MPQKLQMAQNGDPHLIRAAWAPLTALLTASPLVIDAAYSAAEKHNIPMPMTKEQCIELFKSPQDLVALLRTPLAKLKETYGTFLSPFFVLSWCLLLS